MDISKITPGVWGFRNCVARVPWSDKREAGRGSV